MDQCEFKALCDLKNRLFFVWIDLVEEILGAIDGKVVDEGERKAIRRSSVDFDDFLLVMPWLREKELAVVDSISNVVNDELKWGDIKS